METNIKNKRVLTSVVSNKSGVSKEDVDKVMNALSETLVDTLQKGGEIVLPGGIKVLTKIRNEIPSRDSKHPRTGEDMHIERTPSRRVIKSTALHSLKKKVEVDFD